MTKHGKERLVEGLLEPLGLSLVHLELDTDALGTFTRERPREGTAFDAARRKIDWAFEHAPQARFALASEGSFGPHPEAAWVASGHELVLLRDRLTGLELRGIDVTSETNFGGCAVRSLEEARRFAATHDFPSHALVVGPHKGVTDPVVLERLVAEGLGDGPVHLETDMRAHLNPTRRRAIRRALERCFAALAARCPSCAWPGFVISEQVPGLPCEACANPTRAVKERVSRCGACAHVLSEPVLGRAPAGVCDDCNP
ncbi:MAG: hypothetical protein JNJ54_35775 [Myxococcaceae bacterium]|nr:hypothetical protein [Myxococcaceae bacterium]